MLKCAFKCNWINELSELLPHVIDQHPTQVKHLSDPNLDLRIGSNNPVVLVTEHEEDAVDNSMYWLRYHEDDDSNKYVLMLYIGRSNVSRQEEPKLLEYVMSCVSNKNLTLRSEVIINSGSQEEDIENFAFLVSKGTKVNVLETNSLQVTIIKPALEILDPVLKKLECSICLTIMLNGIRLCVNGHSLCVECCSKVKTCPACRARLGTSFNHQLQEVAQCITNIQKKSRKRVHCKYENEGCEFIDVVDEIANHEEDDCMYRIIVVDSDDSDESDHFNDSDLDRYEVVIIDPDASYDLVESDHLGDSDESDHLNDSDESDHLSDSDESNHLSDSDESDHLNDSDLDRYQIVIIENSDESDHFDDS